MTLFRIASPYFIAGLESDGIVRRAAPIIAYMVGWRDDQVSAYTARKGWLAQAIEK